MTLYSWPACPTPVRQQLQQFTGEIQTGLAGNLEGIYLHGSLALGSFNPTRSDLDLLVVTSQSLETAVKRRLIEDLLRISDQPRPIEISYLSLANLSPWQHPAPFELHYSETWREKYRQDLATETWRGWNDSPRYDPDLAAHIMVLNRRGICLAGAAIAEVFPVVPRQDYLASIMADVLDGLDWVAANPSYAILNACRTYAYLHHGGVYSKEEGGVWALSLLPESLRLPVARALAEYRGEPELPQVDNELFEAFATYMRELLRKMNPV